MAIRSGNFNALQKTFLKQSLKAIRFKLPMSERRYMSIRQNGQHIRILSGDAWIICNGKDILLEAGQEMQLPRDRRETIISAIDTPIVSFEIIPHFNTMYLKLTGQKKEFAVLLPQSDRSLISKLINLLSRLKVSQSEPLRHENIQHNFD